MAGRQIVEIVNAWKQQEYPNWSGIRFPDDNQRDPYFRAFVLNDTVFKEENFKQSDEDDLFEENEGEENKE